MSSLTRGYTFGSSESVTNTKLHTLVDSGTCTAIVDADVSAGADIAYTKLALTGHIADSDVSSSAAIQYSKLSLAGTIKTTDIYTGYGLIPSGGIIMWSGTIATIPSGWYLCDGTNGTPNLTNRFVVGADADVSGVAKSTITGAALQTSDGQIPAHTHAVSYGNTGSGNTLGNGNWSVSGSFNTGSTGTGTYNVARFFALAYIQKA